jgi:hypothetical protein
MLSGTPTGTMNTPTGTSARGSGFSRERFQLRNAWNGTNAAAYNGSSRMAQSPFRAVFNAGNVAPSSGNPKYVYDSSLYTMYRKQKAGGRTYTGNN